MPGSAPSNARTRGFRIDDLESHLTELEAFRQAKDNFFRQGPGSPLTPEQMKNFQGLAYFAENPALRFELPLEKYVDPARVQMPTSKGTVKEYLKIGQVKFLIAGETAALQVYESAAQPGMFFIPFVDATAPAESYGEGRYLEPEEMHAGELIVDFNLAYNPYCAYGGGWACPFPPAENRLKVKIEAGEKKFHA